MSTKEIATDNLSIEHGTMLTSVQKENNMTDYTWFSDCDHCKGSGVVIGGDQERQCSRCLIRARDEARKVEAGSAIDRYKAMLASGEATLTVSGLREQEPRYYITDAGRGYAVISKDGDGEYDYFPTLDEAQDALDHLSDPEGDWS